MVKYVSIGNVSKNMCTCLLGTKSEMEAIIIPNSICCPLFHPQSQSPGSRWENVVPLSLQPALQLQSESLWMWPMSASASLHLYKWRERILLRQCDAPCSDRWSPYSPKHNDFGVFFDQFIS